MGRTSCVLPCHHGIRFVGHHNLWTRGFNCQGGGCHHRCSLPLLPDLRHQFSSAQVWLKTFQIFNFSQPVCLHVLSWASNLSCAQFLSRGVLSNPKLEKVRDCSYLIVRYSDGDKVASTIGFYYMANAGGRLLGEQTCAPHIPSLKRVYRCLTDEQ
jgi:hypothetical protein